MVETHMTDITIHEDTGVNDNSATESDHADIMLQVTNLVDSREDAHEYPNDPTHSILAALSIKEATDVTQSCKPGEQN